MARMIRPLANLYEQLRRLPGVGSKTAMRLAYHIIDMPAEEVRQLAEALNGAKLYIHYCSQCYNLTDGELCEICGAPDRDRHIICVVEQPQDIAAMERSRGYNGLYHVLHGVLSPLDGVGPDKLRIRELFQRLQSDCYQFRCGGRGYGYLSGPASEAPWHNCQPHCSRPAHGRRFGICG